MAVLGPYTTYAMGIQRHNRSPLRLSTQINISIPVICTAAKNWMRSFLYTQQSIACSQRCACGLMAHGLPCQHFAQDQTFNPVGSGLMCHAVPGQILVLAAHRVLHYLSLEAVLLQLWPEGMQQCLQSSRPHSSILCSLALIASALRARSTTDAGSSSISVWYP